MDLGTPSRSAPLDVIANSIRRERERLGLTLTELARRAGIAKSTVSQLESATGNPSVETLWALGVALGVPISRLVDPPAPSVRIVRAGEGTSLSSEHSAFTATLLASCPPSARRDVYVLTLEPGPARQADPHIPGTVEHFVVTAGRVRTGPTDRPVDLDVGDYACFPGDIPHIYQALSPGASAVLVMEHV